MKVKLKNVFEQHFIDNLNLNENDLYELDYIKGKDLLNSNRADLIPKIKFLESVKFKYNTSFFEELYKESISVFSYGRFFEPGNVEKNSFDKYKESFLTLQDNIIKNGFDSKKSVLGIGSNGAIVDGGHRTAIAIYNDILVPCIKLPNCDANYGFNYFKKGCMPDVFLDYCCYEYCKMKKNTLVICLWPTLNFKTKQSVIDKISSNLNVIYNKNIYFNYNGMKNFMVEIYGHQDWVGNVDNHFAGINSKVDACYVDGNAMSFLIVEEDNVEKLIKLKKELRNELGLGNHSIHSTDNHDETIQMLSMLLNDNCINFLNKANIDKYICNINILNKIRDNYKNSNFIVSGDLILSLYGLKKDNNYEIILPECDCYDKFNLSFDDIYYNPIYFFEYHGLKFISLDLLKLLKEKNNQHDDIVLIEKIDKNNSLFLFKNNLKNKIKKLIRNLKYNIIIITKKIGIYKFLKKLIKR